MSPTSRGTVLRCQRQRAPGVARRTRRAELSEVFACRPVAGLTALGASPSRMPRLPQFQPPRTTRHSQRNRAMNRNPNIWPCHARSESDEAHLAAALGLDVATYQLLRQLEQRDIRPEDYELLGRLDEVIKPATLNCNQLDKFPARVYNATCCSSSRTTCASVSDAEETYDGASFNVDFWKLPLPNLEDPDYTSRQDSSDSSSDGGSNGLCSVCLSELEDRDLVRALPCAHYFHKECIDNWLLNSSTACPACKRDLSQACDC